VVLLSAPSVIAINQTAFDEAISAGDHELDGRYLKLMAAVAAVTILSLLG
jgi:hypothetical protein